MANDAELLGAELREARIRQSINLQQAEKQTRIRAKYLEALEQGSYDSLPSVVHTRGFLRNYARFLGFDGDVFVSRYDDIISGGGRRRGRGNNSGNKPKRGDSQRDAIRSTVESSARATQTVPQVPQVSQPRNSVPRAANATTSYQTSYQDTTRRFPWGRVVLLGLFAMVMLGGAAFFIYAFVLSDDFQLGVLTPTSESSQSIMIPLETDTNAQLGTAESNDPSLQLTTTRGVPTGLPNPNAVAPVTDGVTLQVNIVARTWLRVTVDEQVQYEGIATPGMEMRYQGSSVAIRAANAVGVSVVANNQEIGLLGARGEIVERVFNAASVAPPTSAVTPQPGGGVDGITAGTTPTPTTPTTSAQLPMDGSTQFTDTPIMSPSATFSFFLPNQTSTPAPGEVRPN
jgi:cytoskeleton protein RodZ